LALLATLRVEHGLSMVFITHDLTVLSDVCDALAVMYAGCIVESGPSERVFVDPRHPYTQALAAAFPTIGDPHSRMNPTGLAGDPPDPAHLPTGCAFHPRCALAEEQCRANTPVLVELSPSRSAACLLVGETVAVPS
jgi:peptide/nickel transport system ATP-binding protein